MKAIVIGGGIGGLAAGIALKRAGIHVDVFERASKLQEIGAGISLWANAIGALESLGLKDAIPSIRVLDAPAGLRSWDGRFITRAPSAELQRKFDILCVVMHRADLLGALFDALGAAHVQPGARCVGFWQDGERVIAEFEDGRRVAGDVLIGADGLHSIVRAGLHGAQPPTYAGYTAWRAVVQFTAQQVHATESWGYGARFGQVPMTGGRVYWYATKNAPEGGRAGNEKAAILQTFRRWHEPIEALIDATDASAILRNDIYDRPVLDRWGDGRVTLLGDAAHPMTPNLGQGACQALEDAAVLAACLTAGREIPLALHAYEARRLRRANGFVIKSRQVGRLGQLEHPAAVWIRNAMLGCVSPRVQARQLERMISGSI